MSLLWRQDTTGYLERSVLQSLGYSAWKKGVKNKVIKFADDTKFMTIITMVHEVCEEMAKSLAKMSDWQNYGR